MAESFKYLLFDLGGVLIELTGGNDFMKRLGSSLTNEEFGRLWPRSEAVRLFETGKISSEDFVDRIIGEFGLRIQPDEFKEVYSKFPVRMYEGADKLLESLSERYPISCLSNTNVVHWEWVANNTRLEQIFDKCLLSFRIGLMKPDSAIFLHAAGELACHPEDIAFFDDNGSNVAAAIKAGFKAFHVNGFTELKNKLLELGITGVSRGRSYCHTREDAS